MCTVWERFQIDRCESRLIHSGKWSKALHSLTRMFAGFALLNSMFLYPAVSHAVPSFARQTGMQCIACHTAYPQLTQFGREFKLNGYVLSNEQSKFPPLAVMLQPSFTHTGKGQAGGAASGFDDNDNIALTQASLFYAGRLLGPFAETIFGKEAATKLNKLGVFLQGTYDGIGKAWSWDNWELRFADTATVRGQNVIYGLYLNNNPTLQDVWNTTPAWGYPFSGSGLAPTPTAATLLGGSVSQQVGGIGAYGQFANSLYVELGGYRTLSADIQDENFPCSTLFTIDSTDQDITMTAPGAMRRTIIRFIWKRGLPFDHNVPT